MSNAKIVLVIQQTSNLQHADLVIRKRKKEEEKSITKQKRNRIQIRTKLLAERQGAVGADTQVHSCGQADTQEKFELQTSYITPYGLDTFLSVEKGSPSFLFEVKVVRNFGQKKGCRRH